MAEAAEISGIECVGLVKSCPGGEFAVGSKVAALMGGLGRTINGSYAEYTRSFGNRCCAIESNPPWEELTAITESYATAWTCLFRNLKLTNNQTLVIRGATSAFGQAALADFYPLLQMASGVYLTFFSSFVFGTPQFSLSDVPLQAIAEKVAAGRYKAKPSRVFRFEDIREAHRVMEANEANGKLVVRL
jgi:NADPH:quinone reductase-like Zn-dependent oxidoreductase